MLIKVIIGVAALAVVALGVLFFFVMRGPDLSQFEHLKEPRITTKANENMLVVKASGDPNAVGSDAFGLLFKTYFRIKGTQRGLRQPAPRARWPVSPDVPASEWVGYYGMPVPVHASELPAHEARPGLEAELTTWEYGEVAEILHVGPYSEEQPTIETLKAFVEDSGYVIIGDHEEEYLRGPGMFLNARPEDYYTIIRYRVKKAQ